MRVSWNFHTFALNTSVVGIGSICKPLFDIPASSHCTQAALALLPSAAPADASPAELAVLARDRSYVEAAWKLYGDLEQPYGAKWEAAQRRYAADMEVSGLLRLGVVSGF